MWWSSALVLVSAEFASSARVLMFESRTSSFLFEFWQHAFADSVVPLST